MPPPFANSLARFRTNEAVRFINSHRVFLYSFVSILSVWAVIASALKSYSNFYSVAIYLSKSSRSVLVLANFGVLLALLSGHVVQRIFFGPLRANEVERLYDRLWFFITESLLAFTIFRDDFDGPFALMFGFLLFVKAFHWLASDRIEWMDQQPYPGPPLLFHFRMAILFAILWTTDMLMFVFAIESTLSKGVGGMVLFASEYAILVASVMNTMLKYMLSAYDLRRAGRRGGENAPAWENKSMWIFYIELATDFMKLTTYLAFFIVIITFYGLPLNIVRDVYVTARSFITRLRALHRYQAATKNMDQRYANATEEELTAMNDRTCIICREEMVPSGPRDPGAQQDGPNTTPKKLPCGHIFHFHCLRSWLERQQSCPTCRRTVLEEGNQAPAPAGIQGQRPNGPMGQQQQGAPGAPGVMGQNPQGGNQQPLGFLGRLFGPPNRLPHNRQPGQNLNNPPAQDGQQAGIFINYQVQYQFPRRQNEANQPAVEALQPVPPFGGFPGPGGVWQPWPVNQEGQARQEEAQAIPTPTPTQPAPTPSSTQPNDSNANPDTATQPAAADVPDLSPREAARQAALRRLGGSQTTDTPSPPAVSSTPTPTEPNASHSQTTQSANNIPQSRPPNLIPLLNLTTPTATPLSPFPPSATQPPTSPVARYVVRRDYSSNITNRINFKLAPGSSSTQANPGQMPSNSSALPESLSEAQLATLDSVTREAIDERLRILERTSVTVYQCINDLLSLRSALPPVNRPPHMPEPSATQSQSPPTESPESDKGKKKAEPAPGPSNETSTEAVAQSST